MHFSPPYLSQNSLNFFRILLMVVFIFFSGMKEPQAAVTFSRFVIHPLPPVLPDLTFSTGEGKVEHLSSFKGQLCVLVFWATWCPHCLPEMKDFEILIQTFRDKGLCVLPLSHDSKPGSVENFYRQKGFKNLPVYYDLGMNAATSLGIRGIPTTILIDREGREIGRLEGGAEWNSQEGKDFLNYYIAQNDHA
jgi:peroxiredoxin